MATKTRCPKCGQLNDPGATRCAQCRAPLVQTCPRCGTVRPWYVQRCPRCDVAVDDAAVFTNLFRAGPERRLQGRYVLRETLSRGAVSALYRAEDDRNLGTFYAVQELSTVALFRADERRQAEAALASAVRHWSVVDHPALPAIVETFASGEAHYVVMELVSGTDLATLVERDGLRITPDLARNWGAQLADLLAVLHAQQPPLHVPFLAPRRVVVDDQGRLRLSDLGLAQIFVANSEEPYGSVRGYGAPELESGPPTAQSDVFAVGRLLYALLVGRLLERGLRRQLPLRQAVPGIDTTLVRAVARAAHRDPRERYATAIELRDALWNANAGPVEPIAAWRELTVQLAPSAAPLSMRSRAPGHAPARAGDGESMESLGFERDPRFGPTGATAAGRAVPATGTHAEVSADADSTTRSATDVRLAIQPRQIKETDLNPGDARRVVLTLRNIGASEVAGRVVSQVPWIAAPRSPFRLPAGKQAKVILTVRAAELPAPQASEPQAVLIDTNAGRQWVGATAQVLTTPLLRVTPASLDWGVLQGEPKEPLRLTISNGGGQPMSGSLAARVPWLRVITPDFRCAPGRSTQIPVQLLVDALPAGTQEVLDALVVDSDGGQERVAARVRRLVPVLDLGVTHIDLGSLPPEITERYLYVSNVGDGALEGSVRPLVPWLRIAPQEVRCAPGEMVQLALTADLTHLGDGDVEVPQAVRVRTNGGTETLSLRVHVAAPRLAVGGADLTFGEARLGDVLRRTITVANVGSAAMFATVQPLVPWLIVDASTLTCAPGEERAIEVTADTTHFPRGEAVDVAAALSVQAGEMAAVLPASITVLQPALRVEPPELDFGYIERTEPQALTLLIANDGNGPLAWNVQTDATWVEIAPASGVSRPGHTQEVRITAYGLAADPDVDAVEGTLVINSDAGRAKVPMRLAFAAPLLSSDTTELDLGTSVNQANVSGSLRLFNYGLGLLRGRITTDHTWLVVDRASFECDTGRSIEVRTSTDMEEFPAGAMAASGTVFVESNGGSLAIGVSVSIALTAVIEPPEPLVLTRDAPDQPRQGRLTLRNSGLATAHVELRTTAPQIELSRNLCDIKPGKSVRIAVRWQGLETPESEAPVIAVLSGRDEIRVPVTLAP